MTGRFAAALLGLAFVPWMDANGAINRVNIKGMRAWSGYINAVE